VTTVARLNREDRIAEIARMIGSSEPTAVTRAAASELLHDGEETTKGESESTARAKAKDKNRSA
jgi:hypothetical protein